MTPVLPKQVLSMQTRDGIRLDADVYYPDGEGPFPVLLMRQPYGRAIASTVVYAHPSWYAAQGYIVVIQDVRGRGTSEGDFHLFATEIEDGADTIAWATALPRSTGTVGMYGFSYQGMTQLYAAIGVTAAGESENAESVANTALKTLCPAMVGYDLYADWAYEGEAFCLQASLGWATQLAAETVRRQGNSSHYHQLYAAARSPIQCDPVSGRSPLLTQLAPESFYHDWLSHPSPDEYWQPLSPQTHLHTVDLPMLHIGGWFDTYMRGTLRLYQEMARRSRYLQHLWVGPWAHLPWGQHVGELDFGPDAVSPIDHVQIRWFDHVLKDPNSALSDEAPVKLFAMGENQWRSLPTWPTPTPTPYYLASTGLAAINTHVGILSPTPNPKSKIQNPKSKILPTPADTLVHDPWRPVPTLGGHATFPAGPQNRAALDDRTDILTYTTALLTEDLTMAGDVTATLYCKTDVASFDLCVVVSDVYPDGRIYNMTQGYRRVIMGNHVEDEDIMPVAIALQPTCMTIPKGHALRLSVSAACYPSYPVNPGTGAMPGEGELLDARVITIELYWGDRYPSAVNLPVLL